MEDPDAASPQPATDDRDAASLHAAMEVPVTAALGPAGPLLRNLHSPTPPDCLTADEIRLLRDDLTVLCISLKDLSEAEDASFTTKWWMKIVRELCYDAEDHLNEFIFSGAGGAHQTAFEELIARVEDARKRRERFRWSPKTIKPDRGEPGASRLTPRLSLQLPVPISVHGGRSIIGVEPTNRLVQLLALDDDDKKLKVIPIFGVAGVGKTTVARTLYHKYGRNFQCRAFVRVSRNPDIRRLLTSMLSQIKAPRPHGFPDVADLIDGIKKHLQGKRYFIIMNDLWTASVWDIISRAFPHGDYCGRIITTTQIDDVAWACCSYYSEHIYEMSPLNDDDSRKLFSGRVFGSEDSCPTDIKEVAYEIVRKCVGLPLAITMIASLLASDPNIVMEKWKHIQDTLSSTSEGMRDVLYLIYNSLPPHLKTFLLYLSMYPEGYPIGKHDLVEQWVAEGFLVAVEGQDTEEIAESYFDELVSRGMVQAVDTNYDGEVLSCTVHHMVLDLIRNKSMQENFVITIDNFQSTPALPDKVRRLSVQFGGAKGARIPESIIWSQVRSLKFCGFFECVPSIADYRLLRVLILHIWADENEVFDLSGIGELFRLRYLKIECNMTINLPAKIGGLQYLETLEIDAKLSAVPSDIVHLEKLLHLRLPSESNLSHGVGHMTSLRTLRYFDIGSNSEVNVMDLSKLTNIQDLHLTCSTVQPAYNLEKNMKCLGSIFWKLSSLKCLALVPAAGPSTVTTLQGDAAASSMSISCDGLSSVYPAPVLLGRLELPRMCIFPSIPKWFGELSKLCILKIAVRELSREDINILKRLPALTVLSLYVWTAPAGWIIFDAGFPVLKYFKFMCTAPYMSFVEGAMPNVRKIKLGFNANRMERHRPVTFGFRHLSGLRVEISVKLFGAGADDPEKMAAYLSDMEAAAKHPINVKFVDWTFFSGQDKSSVKNETISGSCTQPESSSHQNPGNLISFRLCETVARAMEGGMVSASTGAMDSILRKLTVLIADDYPKLRGKQEEVMFLKKELDAMNALFEQLADMPGPNMEMKRMRNQMKEMTYEVEDWIDDLMLKFDEHLHKITSGYPDKWGTLQEFIDQIRNLTAQGGMAGLPSVVHTTEIEALRSSYKVTESGLQTHYNKAVGLVGIDGPRDELVKRMNGGEQHLQVACILGSGGLGKTTLATEVYNHINGPFDRRVFIQVPQKIDITRFHKVILRQLPREQQARYYGDNMGEPSQIDEVRRYLRDKRYLVVIDGVWSAQTWEVLKSALPENKRGSRIVVTTDERDIAESCKKHSSGFIYCMEPLNPWESLSLFRGLLFGSEKSGPMELERIAEKILAACGGIPMAISIMAGILAGIPADVAEWEMVEKRMEPVAEDGDHAKETIRKLFDISYSGLPRDIKCCLLYLSVFPEKHFIGKDRLIWRWIAERFIPKTSEKSSWETGERYFQELIARNLIEPVYEDEKDNYEVPVGCRVHGSILEFITLLSNEENFVTTVGEATHVQHDVIRRLSASYINQEEEDHIWRLVCTELLSKVRSITILNHDQRVDGPLLPWWPLLWGSRFLRILDLEGVQCLRDHHLEVTIEGLVLLRYLGFAGTGISELPEEIGKVEQLETLDLRRTSLRTLPASIGSLRKLVRLLVEPRVQLPSEISKMQELEQVSTIDAASSSSLNSVAELLVKSKPLRKLDVYFDGEMTETCRENIMSFLRVVGNSNLQSLSLCGSLSPFSGYRDKKMLGILLNAWEVPPRHLRRFELGTGIQGVVPPQMASLVSVTHLDIWITELEPGGIRVLGDLPNLVLLKLEAEKSTRFVTSGEKAFECLKVFSVRCRGGMRLELTPGAMPQLQRLRLHFSAQETLSRYGGFDFGIQHLSCLARVHATINCNNATVSEVEGAEAAIRRQVSDFPIKPATEFSRENEHYLMREVEGTEGFGSTSGHGSPVKKRRR